MWYENKKPNLDYSKPILAFSDSSTYLLLPRAKEESYIINSYDWFNIKSGQYNSCVNWKTPEDAVKAYRDLGYKIFNAKQICYTSDLTDSKPF